MKEADLKVGMVVTNGHGSFREILRIDGDEICYRAVITDDADNLVKKERMKLGVVVNANAFVSLASMALWATGEATAQEKTDVLLVADS